jgi:ribosomal protein S18 acetylase RimI-like enzyme
VSEAERIQTYLREIARGFYDVVPVPPFTAFFNARDPLRFFNYAIPDEPVGGDLRGPLERLREAFRRHERLPRFEYVEGFAPLLATALEQAGFELELRAPLMTCPAAAIVEPAAVPGLAVVPAADDVRAFLTVGRRAFGSGDEPEAAEEEVEAWRARRADTGTSPLGLLGLLGGEPIAVASATPPQDGLSEVAGIGVLEHARTQGIGSVMTAAAARHARANGAEVVFLAPGSDDARSVYERVGFRPAETMLNYADPE